MDTDANIGGVFRAGVERIKGCHVLRSLLVFSFDLLDENGTEEFEGKT